VNRQPERLALEIPQRDVDAAQRLHGEAALPVVAQVVVEALPMALDREGILQR